MCERLRLETKEPDLAAWEAMVERDPAARRTRCASRWSASTPTSHDAYKSVQEALIHGGIANDVGVEIEWISSDRFTDQDGARAGCWPATTGCWCPAASAMRGVEGMVEAIRWARENDLPFFGICLGLQVAIIEFARNVCRLPETNSTEFAPECETPVIALMQSQRDVTDLGGTMRLGAYTGAAARRLPRGRRSTAPPRSASATATATRSTTPTATCSPSTGCGSRASRPTAGWSR